MIITRGLFLLITLLMVPLLVLTAWADQVTLKNGDRVTGKIEKKDGAALTFKSDVFGEVTIPWQNVAQVVSDEPLTVVLPDGKSVLGKVATTENKLEVTTQTTKESVAIAEVGAIRNADEQKAHERLEHPGLLNLWTGYADLGVSFARGNADTTNITTAMNATRETRTDKTSLYFNQIYATGKAADGSSAKTAQAVRGGWAYNRNLSKRLFLNLFNDYEYDLFQSLDLRFVFGGGLGYSFIKNDQTQLDLLGGADYNHEKFSTPLTRNSAELYWGDNLLHKFSKTTALTQSFRMFNNMSELGEYRLNFDLGAVTTLKKWLSWQLTVSDRYLSNPIFGHKQNDVLFTTGIRVTFARQ
jgi:putative salt-induced outer membrane protein YdiY